MVGRRSINKRESKRENIVSFAKNVIACAKVEKTGNNKWNEYQLDLVEKECWNLFM